MIVCQACHYATCINAELGTQEYLFDLFMINNLIVCLSDNFTFKTLSEKHWTVGKGSDRQDAKLAYTLISEQTAALLKTYFETDTRMMALYQFISIFSTVRKIMTSRKIWNK